MAMVIALVTLGVALLVTPLLSLALGRNAGWPLAAIYLGTAGVLAPAWADALHGHGRVFSVAWVEGLGINLTLRMDGLGVVFSAIALLIGAAVLIYSTRYLSPGRHNSFYLLMAAFTLSMLGLVFAGDLLVLFISWELTSLASFFLIARSGREAEGPSARTLLLTFIGGLFLLSAVAAVWARTGTTDLQAVMGSALWAEDPGFTTMVAVFVALAAMTKSAQWPFHFWLPDAMAAITPVSAYLHAAAVVKAGIFLLLRFSPLFRENPAWQVLLMVAGLITTVLGGFFALQQRDLKRLMAYSTVSQLGLIVATIGVGTDAALAAAVTHTIAHALFKSGLFMMVGVIDHAVHTRDISRMPVRLLRSMPVSFGVCLIGAASMAGVPPLLGFVSKESLLDASFGRGWVVLGMGFSAVLTFSYCLKLVLGAFIDGPDEKRQIGHRDPWLLAWAALPIVASVPLGVALGWLDHPVSAATTAAIGTDYHSHLALWHGITPALVTTTVVLAIGVVVALNRATLFPAAERVPALVTGVGLLTTAWKVMVRVGHAADRPVASDRATRHVVAILGSLALFALMGVSATARFLPGQRAGLNQPIDLVVLVLMVVATVGVVRSRSRIAATVSLSGVGILATLQILALGAPDVAMTQLLVESLNIIVIMLVLQKLPLTFPRPPRTRASAALAFSAVVGAAVAGLVWALTGRRERSGLAEFFLTETYAEAGGHNVVNVILVEFRAFDTLGELTVLGMAGVAILAIVSTVRSDRMDPVGIEERIAPRQDVAVNPDERSPAWRAMYVAWPNSVAFQMTLRWVNPVLIIVSLLLFWRGHNEPGGGFNAALVAAAIVGMIYMATSYDRQVGPPKLPLALIGGGVLTAVGIGFFGLIANGSFLQPTHITVLGVHLTTSMIFDAGVYAAVLGLMLVTFNLLGTSAVLEARGEGTRERADEAVEGELPGPLDTVRGEKVRVRSSLIAQNRRPRESAR